MACIFQSGKYGAINTADIIKNLCYVIKFVSEEYTLQKMVLWLASTATEDHFRMPVAWHI